MCVAQFASEVRVFPHRKFVATYCADVHDWLMYSEPIHTVFPSIAAAP
jgi:hypothetical protein